MYKIINFLDLTYEEVELVLSWRNNPHIAKWMHNKKTISMEEHLNFVKSLENNPKKDYFLVKNDNTYLGVIDLNKNYLGIYSNPKETKVGDILLSELIKFAFNVKKLEYLVAEVYTNNRSAIKLYKRFNFKFMFENNQIITMELKNENR